MAIRLEPGEVTVRLHYAMELADKDWFGEQDPYVKLKCGKYEFRSNTHKCGGKSPVWNQSFTFKVNQETKLELEAYDEDFLKADDCIGKGEVEIVSVRIAPDRKKDFHVPLFRRLSNRQQGHIFVTLTFTPENPAVPSARTGSDALSSSSSGDLLVAHSEQDEANRKAAATFAAEKAAGGDNYAGGLSGTAAGGLPAGLVSAGAMPDNVPSCAPTCGLIAPQPHQMLPCHQGRISGSNVAASPTPTQPVGTPGQQPNYPSISALSFDFRSGLQPDPAASLSSTPAMPQAPMPPQYQPSLAHMPQSYGNGVMPVPQPPPPAPYPAPAYHTVAPASGYSADPAYQPAGYPPPPAAPPAQPYYQHPSFPAPGPPHPPPHPQYAAAAYYQSSPMTYPQY